MYQPYPSTGGTPEPVRPEPPASVITAVRLMYAGAAVSALSLVVSLLTVGSLRNAVHRAYPSFTSSQLHTAEVAIVGLAVFSALLGIGLWVWMALANKAGKSWARIMASVLFGLNTLFLVTGFTRPSPLGSRLVTVLIWLIGAGAIMFLWRAESSQYFEAGRGQGRPGGRGQARPGGGGQA